MAAISKVNPASVCDRKERACAHCHATPSKLMKCGRCHFETYCSQKCQAASWPQHKKVCVAAPKSSSVAAAVDPVFRQSQAASAWEPIEREASRWRGGDPLIHLDPRIFPCTSRSEFWDFLAQDAHLRVAPLLKYFINHQGAQLAGKIAMDLGCASGVSSLFLLENGWKVISIDNAPGALELLRVAANKKDPKWIQNGELTIQKQDLNGYDFTKKVTLILANDLFPYLDPTQFQNTWRKIYEALEDDGYLIGSFMLRLDDSPLKGVMSEMGAWFVDSSEIVEALFCSPKYKIVKFKYEYSAGPSKPSHYHFIAQKLLAPAADS